MITPKEFQKYCLTTEKTPTYMVDVHGAIGPKGEPSPVLSRVDHAAKGMVTEAGEVVDMLKKHSCYGKTFDKVNALEEVGDTLWYCSILLDALGYSFEDAMQACVNKLQKRYPQGFTEQAALNRNLVLERQILEDSAAQADSTK